MSEKTLLEKCLELKLVEKKKQWYYYKEKGIGNSLAKVEDKLKQLVNSGELVLPIAGDKVTDTKTKKNVKLETVKDLPENTENIFKSLTGQLGNIEHRRKGGRFNVYIFGVNSKLKDHPVVKACPFEFRHNDKKRNIRSGNSTFNDGWTVLSKKLIEKDPRSGLPWLTVARDDTPDEDMFTVSNYVLCYADKGQFRRKKGKMVMDNLIRAVKIADSRQEHTQKMAKLSSTNPEESIKGYANSNKADQSIAKETLEKNQKLSSNEAEKYIEDLNSISNEDVDIDEQVKKLSDQVNAGQIGNTMTTKALNIEDV